MVSDLTVLSDANDHCCNQLITARMKKEDTVRFPVKKGETNPAASSSRLADPRVAVSNNNH